MGVRKFRKEFADKEKYSVLSRHEKILDLERVADNVPYFEGDKGIGKTAIISSYAEKMGMDLIKVELANIDRVDFNGLMKFLEYEKGSGDEAMDQVAEDLGMDTVPYHTNTVPDWVRRVLSNSKKNVPTLLFFDEINRSPVDVVNAIMNTLLEREYGSQKLNLPTETFIVAAGNPDNDEYNVSPMDKALQGRVMKYSVKPDFDEWVTFYARKNDVHPCVIRYLKNNENHFHFQTDNDDEAGLDPRRWTMISNQIKAYEALAKSEDDISMLVTMLRASAGIDVGNRLVQFYKENQVLTLDIVKRVLEPEIKKSGKNFSPKEITEKVGLQNIFDDEEHINVHELIFNMLRAAKNKKIDEKVVACVYNVISAEMLILIDQYKSTKENEEEEKIYQYGYNLMEKLDQKYPELKLFSKMSDSIDIV